MHIAIVTGGYYGLSGAYTNARELAIHLADRGQVVTVLSPDVDEAQGSDWLNFARIQDIPLIPQNFFCFTTLLKIHRERPIDIVQVYDSIGFLAACPFAKLNRIPTVFSMQASIFSEGRSANYSWLTTQIYKFTNHFVARRADRLICISQEMVRCALHAGATEDRLVVIPNPVDLSSFHPADGRKDSQTCLYVGALSPVKGVEFLIRAIPLILQQIPNARFLLVGDGPDRKKVENLIKEYGIVMAVSLIGYVPHEKLPAIYQQSDLFVMPSLNEPQGVVALEAMACGLPVVASRVGGIPEMVEDGYNGLMVPPRDPQTLAEAIIRILSNGALREHFSESALRTVQGFSWQQNIHRFLCVYAALKDG